MNENEFRELAAGDALHALSFEDALAFRAAASAHPEWRSLMDEDREIAAALADGVAEIVPPPGIRAALLERIQTLPQEPVADVVPARPRASRRWFALAASIALVLAVGIGGLSIAQLMAPPAAQVALEQIEQAPDAAEATVTLADGGTATAHWSPTLERAVLVADGLPELTDDQTFELWFVRGDGAVSAGTFDATDSGAAVSTLAGEFRAGDVIAVTVEQAGGSPTGAPTTDPIFAITT